MQAQLWNRYIELLPQEMQLVFASMFGNRAQAEAESWHAMHGSRQNFGYGFHGRHPVEFDFLDTIGRRRFEFAQAWRAIALQSGMWWFSEDGVIFSERPKEIIRNDAGEVSCAKGPAIIYPDGQKLYAWRNQPILEILQRASVVDLLSTFSMEQGSIGIEMYGYERFLKAAHAYREKIDVSRWGTLWRVQMGRAMRFFVEVRNSTVLPDGTRPTYVLPVDPWMRPLTRQGPRRIQQEYTALNAIASTFGMTGEEYQKIVEA